MLAYALTIFTGAFLLFQVQPLIGKFILPWFGGSPGVWTTCMVFFQFLLLGGYAYAHFVTQKLKPRNQVILHVALLAAAVATLPIIPGDQWKPAGGEEPVGRILLLLAATLGLPYFILSTTGPLMQEWFRQTKPGVSPYRLYALSNVGSLLALVSYPFFFEPAFQRRHQAWMWSAGMVVFALLACWCAKLVWNHARAAAAGNAPADAGSPGAAGTPAATEAPRPGGMTQFLWVVLPACASLLLVAITNKLCQDVAVIPFLWVLPLGLYLVTFILCFDHSRWYVRPVFAVLFILCAVSLVWALFQGVGVKILLQVLIYASTLFVACMICHGELYRLKPHPKLLTRYFLLISLGGALGGLFVGVVAPRVFNSFLELHIGLGLCALLLFWCCMRDEAGESRHAAGWDWMVLGLCTVPPAGAVMLMLYRVVKRESGSGWSQVWEGMPWVPLAFCVIGLLAWLRWVRPFRTDEARSWEWLGFVLVGASLFGLDRLVVFLGPKIPNVLPKVGLTKLAGWFEGKSFRTDHLHWLVWIVFAIWLVIAIWRKTLSKKRDWHEIACSCLVAGVVGLIASLVIQVREADQSAVYWSRNFYGTLTIFEYRKDEPTAHYFLLQHGKITHGFQFTDPDFAKWTTSYYGSNSGVGLAWAQFPTNQPRHLGVVGLGTGTLATYAKAPTDTIRFYDINPAVTNIAQTRFTYLSNCVGKVNLVMGDARLSMESELKRGESQKFDVLALDAFSSDAIPAHLLTREAMETYLGHIKTNGVIAIHISNRYLDLEPVVQNLAEHFKLEWALISDSNENDWWIYSSSWVLVSANKDLLAHESIASVKSPANSTRPKIPLWTDDFASLFQILNR